MSADGATFYSYIWLVSLRAYIIILSWAICGTVPSNSFQKKSPYSLRLRDMTLQLVSINSNNLFWHVARVGDRSIQGCGGEN